MAQPELIDRLGRLASSAVGRLQVRSALNPALWLCTIPAAICFTAAYYLQSDPLLRYGLVGLGALPIIVACFGFVYLVVARPEMLQSEDYQIRHESLQIIQQKVGHMVLDTIALEAIANPALSKLPAKVGEEP